MVQKGWNDQITEDVLKPYMQRKDELSILDGCVLWGNRVIIPMTCRKSVVKLLHDCHPGITKMKPIARSLVWWAGIDSEISLTVEKWNTCQVNQSSRKGTITHLGVVKDTP